MNNNRMVWIDCEMTGLEPEKNDTIVQVAVIVTDNDLNVLAVGPDVVINHPEQVLSKMNDWCKEAFTKNGLLERIRHSKTDIKQAESLVLRFLHEHTTRNKCVLAGNTVYMDMIFLRKDMPRVAGHLHHHIIDVSAVRELAMRWYSLAQVKEMPKKKLTHLAMDDIRESIEELKWLRSRFFK